MQLVMLSHECISKCCVLLLSGGHLTRHARRRVSYWALCISHMVVILECCLRVPRLLVSHQVYIIMFVGLWLCILFRH